MSIGILAYEKLGPPFNEAWRNEVRAFSHSTQWDVLTRGMEEKENLAQEPNYHVISDAFPPAWMPFANPIHVLLFHFRAKAFAHEHENIWLEGSPNYWSFFRELPLEKCVHHFNSRYWIQKKGMQAYITQIAPRVRGIIVSHAEMKKILSEKGIDEKKIHVIHPGIDLDYFKIQNAPAAKKQKNRIFTFLFASAPTTGDNAEEKFKQRGIDSLLEGFASFQEKQPARLRLVWRGRFKEALLQRIRALGIEHAVEVIDERIMDMRPHYHETDATILVPASPENMPDFPASLMESIACGKPVILADSLGIAIEIKQAGAGIAIATGPGTAARLEAAMLRLEKNYPSYQKNTRKTAERHFDINTKAIAAKKLFGKRRE